MKPIELIILCGGGFVVGAIVMSVGEVLGYKRGYSAGVTDCTKILVEKVSEFMAKNKEEENSD